MPMDDLSTQMRDKARRHGDAMLGVLVEIAEDPDAKPSARVSAARSVLERGFGTPERHTTTDMNVNVFDAREAHYEALKKLAAEPSKALTDRATTVIEGQAVRLSPPPAKSDYEE